MDLDDALLEDELTQSLSQKFKDSYENTIQQLEKKVSDG